MKWTGNFWDLNKNIDNETKTNFIYGTKSKISFWTLLICYRIVSPKNLCSLFDSDPHHYTAESNNGEQQGKGKAASYEILGIQVTDLARCWKYVDGGQLRSDKNKLVSTHPPI